MLAQPCITNVAKVPGAFRCRKGLHRRGCRRGKVKPLPLIIHEEKQLVLFDGSAERGAKHIPTQLILRQTEEVILPTIRVELIIADELKGIAVVLVRS